MSIQVINDPYAGGMSARLGRAMGQGLAENLPKMAQQYKLRKGLENFSKNAENMTPLQQYAYLNQIEGLSPQAMQTFGELARSQTQANALKQFMEPKPQANEPPPKFPKLEEGKQSSGIPSITTPQPIEETIKPYIPMTQAQKTARAGELYNQSPGFFKNDPQQALAYVDEEDKTAQQRSQAIQNVREGQQKIQGTVLENLRQQASHLNVQIPAKVYSELENEAVRKVLPKEEGGEGKTERQASQEIAKEMDAISRDYSALEGIGNWSMLGTSPNENKRSIKATREGFKKRGDLENFADTLIGRNGLSPMKAYYLAYPVSDEPQLKKEILSLPKPSLGTASEAQNKMAAVKLSENLGDGSPLSVAQELYSRGYDPDTFLNYLSQNRGKYRLDDRQIRELERQRSFAPTLNDIWLFGFTGIDELAE